MRKRRMGRRGRWKRNGPWGPSRDLSGVGEHGLHPPGSGGMKAYTVKPMRCHDTMRPGCPDALGRQVVSAMAFGL